ncbi:rubrerythrin family protein [Halorarius halobius]|uniref:rubrerythrin family protein n=1 Tax=Halorarius halobius TaxID=2962671 RepID=UPI0020CC7CF7|nr:rubrerythrin family protein [Halorarius halobius]
MNGSEVVAAVREAAATELDRLGSEKSLVAATDAALEREAVLRAAAAAEARARDTFEAWADDGGPGGEAFAAAAATERDHHERVVALLDETPDAPDPDALHAYLRRLDAPPERVGAGLVGRSMAAERSLLQFVNFFVNEGARSEADLFRELRSDTEATVETGAETLDAVCETDEEYERAREAAVEAIGRAYSEYADSLEAMGVDPKPVC